MDASNTELRLAHQPDHQHQIELPPTPARIVPRNKAKGTDLCGQSSYQYIIRSDLDCYLKAYHLRDGDDPVTIHPLHPTCAWGDHYMATPKHFYIIKGSKCRRVTDLSTGAEPTTFSLSQNVLGDFYMAKDSQSFFVIQRKDLQPNPGDQELAGGEEPANQSHSPFKCMQVLFKELKKDSIPTTSPTVLDKYLPTTDDDMEGWYYWSTAGYFYFLKPITDWNLEYHRTPDLNLKEKRYKPWSWAKGVDFPVYPPITAFLPGGLAVIMGPTFDRWEQLLSIPGSKEGDRVDLTIKRKQGYKKPIVNPVQNKWNMSQSERSTGLTTEDIFKAALKRTFYFPAEYGGLAVDATKEDWSDVTEVEEVIIRSQQHVYVWQYVLGIGDQVVLYTKHVKKTIDDSEPQNAGQRDNGEADIHAQQNAGERRGRLVPLSRTQFSEEHNCFVTLLQHNSNRPNANCLP